MVGNINVDVDLLCYILQLLYVKQIVLKNNIQDGIEKNSYLKGYVKIKDNINNKKV